MLARSVRFVTDVRHRADSDPEDAVSRRGNSSVLYLPASSREIQERRRVIVPGADDKRNLIFFLQIIELFGKLGKLIERANSVRAERKIPNLKRVRVLLKRFVQRLEEFLFQQRESIPFCGIFIRDHLKVEDTARAVVEPGDSGIKLATPTDEARYEGAVICVPVG